MSTSFFEYVEMHEDGRIEESLAYRAYDLSHRACDRRVKKALRRAGYTGSVYGLASLQSHLASRNLSLPIQLLKTRLGEWYVWDRICTGEIHVWKEKGKDNVLR